MRSELLCATLVLATDARGRVGDGNPLLTPTALEQAALCDVTDNINQGCDCYRKKKKAENILLTQTEIPEENGKEKITSLINFCHCSQRAVQ